jgi:biotin synthase
MDYQRIAELSLSGEVIDKDQALGVLSCPDAELLQLLHAAYKVRHAFFGNRVQVQILTNAKSGFCSEDCRYCAQSSISIAKIDKYPLLSIEELIDGARRAKKYNAKRYCTALSGIRSPDKDIDTLCQAFSRIRDEVRIETCCSIGLLTREQARRLKQSGLDRVNHNLNSSRRYFPKICSTHTFDDRMNNLMLCREAGLEICSGGIVGQGETREDVADLLLSLKEIDPKSIPLNFLIPIKGTPFEDRGKNLTPQYCLKVLALARFIFPDKEIRAAGGRERHLRSLQGLALYPANSIFISGYLTAKGQTPEEAFKMIDDLGFQLEIEYY